MKQNCKSSLFRQHRNTHKTSQTLTKRPTSSLGVKRRVLGQKWCEMGDGVFIRSKSSERSVLEVYVRCYCTVVQRLFCTIRYYPVDSVNSATYVRYFGVRLLYCSQSTIVLSIKAYIQWGTTVCPHYRQQRMFGVSVYIRTKRQ